jgi:4-diphosphocytidyl-2-C-methyl-D-erythritol kinase
MRLLAPAKINLHLRVGPPRADGFHPLVSWFVTVGLFDMLTLEAAAGSHGPRETPGHAGDGGETRDAATVTLQCDLPGLPTDERNLVVKIAHAWGSVARGDGGLRHVGGFRATLAKRIPVGAGLGGGSSDAARMLLGLNQLWGTSRAADELSAFAARFGSDLPFFFFGPSSVCSGRGEIVRPLPRPTVRWAVLVLPDRAMPTADVYRRFDAMGLGREQDLRDEPDWHAWAKLDSEDLLPKLVNDLEAPAFDLAPDLGALRSGLEQMLSRPVRMSGSGSSLFTLYDERADAEIAAEKIVNETRQRAIAVELAPDFRDDLNGS